MSLLLKALFAFAGAACLSGAVHIDMPRLAAMQSELQAAHPRAALNDQVQGLLAAGRQTR